MSAEEIEKRLEFENARLKRVLDQFDQAAWRGNAVKAATYWCEAKSIRDTLNHLEDLYSAA